MKRTYLTVVLLFIVIILNGCTGSDLASYQAAVEESASITQGEMEIILDVDMVFEDEGLTFEERRDLSYFERVDVVIDSKFDEREDGYQMVADSYISFGGMGIDSTVYMSDEISFMELPIVDGYILMGDGEKQINDESSYEAQGQVIEKIMDKWYEVLQEEDVFSGQKDYVMTDKGQIKTTTYTITINDPQFQILKEALTEIIEDEQVLETFLNTNNYESSTLDIAEIQDEMKTMTDNLSLDEFTGIAYVDFDGRLAKQVIEMKLVNDDAESKEIKSLSLHYEVTYDNLGVDPQIEFPEVDETNLSQIEDMQTIQEAFYK